MKDRIRTFRKTYVAPVNRQWTDESSTVDRLSMRDNR